MDRSSVLSRLVTQASPAEITQMAAAVDQWLGAEEQGPGPAIAPPGGMPQVTVTRAGATAPFLVLPLNIPAAPVPVTLPVGAGSLWFDAQLLAASAPPGGFAGLAVTGGTITFDAPPTAAAGGLQVAAGGTVTVTVTPAGQSVPVGGGDPGGDGGAVVADTPAAATFVFTQAGGQVTAAGTASLRAYGATVALNWQNAPASYDSAGQQLLVPFQPQTASFAVTSVLSVLFTPAGTAPVQAAAWAFPVSVTAPAQLGAAADAGLLRLQLGAGLTATWAGLGAGVTAGLATGSTASLGDVVLAGAPGELSLTATASGAGPLGTLVSLWVNADVGTARSTLDLTVPAGSALRYISEHPPASQGSSGPGPSEVLTCEGRVAGHVDRPVAANGSRLSPVMPGGMALHQTASASTVLVAGQAPQGAAAPPPISLALHNALLVTTPPQTLLAAGNFTASPTELDSGGLELGFTLNALLPTLPDPYAASFFPQPPAAGQAPGASGTSLLASVVWTPAATTLSFTDSALTGASLQSPPLPPSPRPSGDTQRDALERVFDDAIGSRGPGYYLLDVSSNVDQLGVGLAIPAPTGAAAQQMSITGLDLVAPCATQRVFTVPAVQWEPVVTVANPDALPYPFPSPAGFADDGGPTLLASSDVTLVPVTPGTLLKQVLTAYDGGESAAVLFTLPFGIVATATLPVRPKLAPPGFVRPGLGLVQPGFASQDMTGGLQVSLTQGREEIFTGGGGDLGLPGAAVQLRNLVDQNGNPVLLPPPPATGGQPVSVLGPAVDETFNSQFGPGGAGALVPVTRVDLSGYGASTFSDWTDPAAVPPAVVQVRFSQLTGRASHEVVQVKSVLYPWGATVVRTITIDRQDDNEIYRYDSGWVAATPGVFAVSGFTFHPGAVKGAYNIREISETTQVYSGPGGLELTGVYFDADLQIEGVLAGAAQAGASQGLVPSSRQFGFVQTAPAMTPLTPDELAALITSQGALGGPVDCVISVGGTAQTMRVSRVEVGNAPHAGAAEPSEFAAVARGTAVLPQPGNWSVLQRTDTVSEPVPVDPDLGVPLIQQGPANGPASTGPWRLAEAVDLWTPDTPSVDYCLLHATDATRMIFPRPQLAAGAAAFTSDQVPLLADGFALMNATGICPRQDACLTFPNASYQLQISGAGAFTLTGVPATFAPSQGSRVLAAGSAGTIAFEYANQGGAPAQVAVAISPTAWSVQVNGANVRLDMTPFDAIMRTVGNFQASSGGGVAFQDTKLVLGSVLQPLEDLLTFLEELGLPEPLSTSFSNAGWTQTRTYKLKAGLQFKLPSPLLPSLTPLLNTSLGSLELAVKTGFGNTASSAGALFGSSAQWLFYFNFSGTVQTAVLPPLPAKAGGLASFGLEVDFPAGKIKQTEKLSFSLGVIATVGGDIVPKVLKLQASVAFAFKLNIGITSGGPTSVTVGVGLILSGSAQIPSSGSLSGLASITFTAEADGLITVTTPRTVTATFDISVDVSLCWFLDVSFDVQTQYKHALP